MKILAKKIPMPCWMTALPQLISRICHDNMDVAELVRRIITDAAIMYPQQVLWALTGVSKSGRANRRNAATSIINGAKRKSNEANKRIFAENSVLCEQLYKLCHFSPADGAKVISAKKCFSHLFRIMPLGVIMPTLESLTIFQMMDLHKEGDIGSISGNLVTIAGIQDEIHIMTSLMKPKKIVFLLRPKHLIISVRSASKPLWKWPKEH
jgi:serine/threonine-protein kinase ATR